jgi:signal transduction histidine kinase
MAKLTVSDTGEGIASEPIAISSTASTGWTRHAPTPSSAESQTGLGLAIVKAIVELHGGSVAAQSTPGLGTALTLLWKQ